MHTQSPRPGTPPPVAPTASDEPQPHIPCEPVLPPTPRWAAADRALPALLLLFALGTRLWGIAKPAGIVFDELHFGKFVSWTMNRLYYFGARQPHPPRVPLTRPPAPHPPRASAHPPPPVASPPSRFLSHSPSPPPSNTPLTADIHPPFAKLTLAFVALLWRYDPNACDYDPPAGASRNYAPECEFWKLRVVVAVFSAFACLLMYFIARRLGASVAASSLAALLEVFSVMHAVEGRLVLLNSQLIFWLNASLYAGLLWFARANQGAMALGERLRWALGVGLLCGNAMSVKHTGLGTPALLALEGGLGLFFLRRPLPALDLMACALAATAIYIAYFAVHLGLMVRSGPLRMEEEFMSPQYQSLLLGSATYDPAATWTEGFWWTAWTLNKRMVVHSAAITQPHSWSTRPWEWIFALRGVSYWGTTMGGGADDKAAVYLIPNAVTNWMVAGVVLGFFPLAALLLARTAWQGVGRSPEVDFLRGGVTAGTPWPLALYTAWRGWAPPLGRGAAKALATGREGPPAPRLDYGAFVAPCLFCAAGFFCNLAPYAAVVRTTFAYHYMPALVYGHLALCLCVDRMLGAVGAAGVAAVAGGVWAFFLPWIYGWPLTEEGHAARRWLPRWN